MRRSWSFFYGLHLLGSAYFGMTYRNWLERQFQSGRFDRAFRDERLAVTPLARPKGQLLWVHIDSQETALNLSEFLSRLSDMGLGQILLTSEEDLSKHVCEKRLPAGIIYQHAPIGTRSVIRRFLDHWRPDMVLWASPKLTFRVLHEFRKNQKSMVWLDIRLTLRDRRFWRLKQNYVRSLYGRFDLFLCQDRMTQKLLRSMGVEGKKTKVIGSFTGGGTAPGDDKFRRAEWSSCLKDRQIWLAAHVPPGELNTVYDAFTKAKRQAHRLLMVLHTNSARPDGLRGDQLFISNNPDPKEYDRAWDVIIIPQSQIGMWYR
ncbi:MAG: glycosyltransferase N-terminal domain-containing protein, partial [Pseudomonadota bacterium]